VRNVGSIAATLINSLTARGTGAGDRSCRAAAPPRSGEPPRRPCRAATKKQGETGMAIQRLTWDNANEWVSRPRRIVSLDTPQAPW
jgi:hypothetical protein